MDEIEPATQFQPAQAQAWEGYVNETTAARQRYDRVTADARDRFQQTRAAAQAAANIASEYAWEQYQAELVAAWTAYESDTRPARRMRDWSVTQSEQVVLPT